MENNKRILPIIVISQFFCTSLWFASNGVMDDLVSNFNLIDSALSHLTSAVQFGFIIGTLIFAILTIADRFSPSNIFFISAVLGALFNSGSILESNTLSSLLMLRFLTGFFLAGIYPIGMKIAADYYKKGLGKSLGFLLGALVLGTAFPHLLKEFTTLTEWKLVLLVTSFLAVLGGLLMLLFVPNGPYRKSHKKLELSAFTRVFKNSAFRSAAFGYFGHMWEVYAFYAFVPVILATYTSLYPEEQFSIPLLSFLIIGIGSLGCVLGGYLSQHFGTKKIAFLALLLSCLCCLVSPLLFKINSSPVFIGFLIFWGLVVIADSPLFSTLIANNTLAELKGTALTIVNCIGFAITIISIQLLSILKDLVDLKYIYTILALGPLLGLIALYDKRKNKLSITIE